MATNNEDIQWLYGKLKAKGYDIGTEQEFSSSLSNEEDRKWYYDKAKGMGLDVGSKADFDSLFTPQDSAKEEVPQVNTALEGLPNGIAPMEQVPGLDGWKPQTKVPVQIPNTPEDNDTEGAPIANLDPMALATTFSEESRQMVGDTGRMLGAMTPDGRKKQQGLEIAGRMAGRNTRLPGLSVGMPTPEQPEASDGAQAAPKAQDMRGPQYYGTVVDQEDGQTKDQWLMPDGSLTSDFYEADVAAGEARSARLQREFERRMAINGLDTSKSEDVAAQQAYDRLAQLEARAKMHSDEKLAKLEERYEKAGAMERGRLLIGQNGNTVTSMVTVPASVYGNGIYDDEDKLIAAERKNLEDAITAHHAGKLKKTGSFFAAQNLVNAWEGVKDVFKDGDTYTAGMTSMHQSAQMLAIKAKLDKGEALTRGEESLLESMLVKQTIDENVEKPHGYTMGYTIANMVPFMIQMAMNPAAGAGGKLGNMAVKEFAKMMAKRAGQRATKGFMMKAVAKLGKKRAAAIAKGIGVTAGDIVASAGLANTLQAPATMADAALRYAGDVAYDKDGTLHFEGGDGMIKAFAKAEGAMLIEDYTEMLGAHFGVIGGAIGRGTGKAVRKLGGGKLLDNVMKLCANIRATDWAKGIAAIERRAQWNGSVGEVLEEEAGIVLNSIFTGDNSISDLWDKEQQIDIVLGVGAFGAFVSGIKTAGYPIACHKARKALDERAATCEASFGKNWDSIRETIDMADEADLAQTIAHLGRRYAPTPEKAKALLEYASAMAKARAFNIASASAEEMQTNPEQRQIDQSYNNGYTAEGSGRADVQNLYNAQRERVLNTLDADTMRNLDADSLATLSGMASAGIYTDEELSVAREYAAAKSAYDGMQQNVEDEIEAQIWRCNAAIDARTNRDTGMVQRATYGLEDREVYIIKGNVVADENGVIDRSASDDTIAIVDLETGETKMVASKDLGQAEQPMAAEQFKSSMAAYVRQEIGDRARAQAEGRLLFEENEKCLILDDEGSQSEVTILGGATDEQGAPIADAVKVQYADSTTGVVAMSELQEQVNAAAAARMGYAEQERQQGAAARAAVDAEADSDAEQDGLAVEDGGQRRSFALNDEVELIADQGGVTSGMITGEIDSDGLIEVQTDKPVNGQMVNRLTFEELMERLSSHNGEIVDEAEVEAVATAGTPAAPGTKADEAGDSGVANVADVAEQPAGPTAQEEAPAGYGDFGPIFTQFKGDSVGAINKLIKLRTGEAIGALHHKEVGDIDLVWGIEGSGHSDGMGLAKLVKYHPEVVEHLQEILDDMRVVRRTDNRINLESDTHKAAVRLTWNHEAKKWLLTAFEKKETPESIDKTTDTGDNPADLRGDTALSQNSGVSDDGKDINSASEKQEDSKESLPKTEVSALERLPKNEKGEPIFEKAESPEVGWDALVEFAEGDAATAKEIADTMVEGKRKAYEKVRKQVAKGKTPAELLASKKAIAAALARAQGEYETWQQIANVEQGRQAEERQNNLPKDEVTSAERTEMAARIVDWLSDENLSNALGKTRDEIFEEFGNELKPIAYIPSQFVSLVSPSIADSRIYCGKGYFIDHALHNHGAAGTQVPIEDVDVSKYLNIQTVLDNPDTVKETTVDGKRTVIFIKKIGRFFAELTQVEEDGKIVLHKSLFNQKKEPYAKLNDIRQKDTSSEGGTSSISHAENSAPAISLESRGDVKGKLVRKHADDVSSASDVADGLFSSQGNQSDPVTEGTDAPQTNNVFSERKVTNSASEKQESREESSAQTSENEVESGDKTLIPEKAYQTIAERVEYSIEIRPNQNGDIFAIRLKKGAKLSEWKNAVGAYGIWSNDGRGEVQFDSFDAMLKYLESRGEEVESLLSKEKWSKRDKEINDALFEQTGIREGQTWKGPDGTIVKIGARGFVKGPDGWDFATTVVYPDGRTESTLTPATRISEYFSKHRFESAQTAQAAVEAESAERGRGAEGDKPSLLDAVRTLFEKGKAAASKLFQMKFFDVAETPDFMKALGLTGDKFTIRYGVIARHIGKDAAHEIPEEIWAKLPEALKAPFAITKYYQDENKKVQKGYRLYTTLRLSSGAYVVVSAEVKNIGRELEVNAINTIFGREALSDVHDELIYKSDTITPEQQSLLNGNNPHQYPATRELSDGKVNNSASDKQGEDVKSSVQERLASAESEVNTAPTEAQKKAGNYKMGHVEIDGLQISIENPKGSMRRGKDPNGTPWETEMKNTYGYIKGTTGVDGDKIDVFLSDNPTDGDVYVVDQYNTDGTFDEHKVMYGFTSASEAEVAYLSNYSADWAKGRKVVVTGVTREEFKKWLDASDRKKKPFAEYKSVKPIEAQNGGAAEAAKLRQKSSRLEIEGAEKLSAERAEAVERYAEGHYCVPIRVIADEADIRESGLSDVAVAQMMAALTEEDVPAVYCREDKKIYIFAGHKDSNVGSTLAHENFHALTDAIGDARENRYMLDEYRYLLLADLDHGEDFSRIWKAVADAYPPHKRAEEFVAYTVGLMYVSEGAAKAIRRILDGNAKSSIFQQLINPILYGTQTKTDAYRSANSENRRGGGAGVQQGRAGNSQAEGRADGEESAGEEIANEPRRRYVARKQATTTGMSLFDWADAEERGRREVTTKDEKAIAAEEANAAIDGFVESYSRWLGHSAEIEAQLDAEGVEGELREELTAQMESEETRITEERDKLEDKLRDYYATDNTPEDATRIAHDMVSRVQAEVEIRHRKEHILSDLLNGSDDTPIETISDEAAAEEKSGEVKTGGGFISYNALGHLPDAKEGEFAYVERKFSRTGEFSFTGADKIRDRGDVAYLFRSLENYSVENVFAVLVKDGTARVLHIGMGTATSSLADMSAIRAGVDAFGADRIYLVHNHPSGTMIASQQDRNLMRTLEAAFGDKIDVSGIIIDTTSGRYVEFDGEGQAQVYDRPRQSDGDKMADVFHFDQADRSNMPEETMAIRSSSDVANAIGSLRFGDGKKVSYLILAHNGHVIGNFHTEYSDINASGLAEEMASVASKYGGTSVVVYGNMPLDGVMRLKDAVARHSLGAVRLLDTLGVRNGIQMSAVDEGMLYEDGMPYGSAEMREPISEGVAEEDILCRPVTDKATIDRLNSEPTIKAYRAMQLIDGGLRPPMSGKVEGQWREATEVGVWEEAEERPEMADENGRFKLDKGNGKYIWAAYNPYIHTSRSPINDQFSSAWSRPELVIVEVEIPESELTSGYHAEKAKDAVGEMEWKSGPVGRALAKIGQPRRVILSRWSRIIRVVPVEEVAEAYAQRLNAHGIEVPFNTVPPALREALAERGVKIGKPEKGNAGEASLPAFRQWIGEQERMRQGDKSGATGRDRFGEKRQAELAARERERMAARIRELAERLHLDNVEVVTDASQLEGVRATAKGFFNKRTGKITIVLPNNLSTIDAEQTLLHEAVAHYGLRRLFGEHFDAFLDNVYESATEEIRRKIAEMVARNGWNFRTATEEYLAGLAENTDFEAISRDAASQSWWAKVKQLFIDMVERVGFKGFRDKVGVTLTDNELRYILWRSYANLAEAGATRSIFGEAADIAKQAELKVGNYAEGGIEADYVELEDVSAVNERFNEQLERWSSGVMRPEEVVQVGVPTGILSSLMPPVPILLRQKVLSKSRKKHGLSAAEMKNLPEALGRSIFVFKSSPETISVLTALKSADGNNLFVAIELGKDLELGGRAMIVNDILTIHGREIENVVLPILHNDSLVWADKKKGLEWLRSAKSNSQANTSQTLDDAAKKVKEFENPKLEEEELYRPGDFSPRDEAIARWEYERMVSSGGFQFQEAMQDSMLGLKKFYQAILGNDTQIEDVAGFENAYLFENRMSSMNAGEQHEYFRRFMEPLLKEIAKIAGANQRKRKELTDYIMAKHGLERSEHMRNEAAANGENTDRDFAGLIGLTGEADWRSAEATAKQWVDDYERLHDTTGLWKAINNATKATLEKVYLSGIISKKTYEEIRDMYEYYIPLRGWNETTSDQVYGYLTSKDGPLGGSIMKKAEGRSSMADDPIATIAMMADDAIRQGNRNLMKQRFLNFVLNHPSDVASVHDIWLEYDDVADEWRPVFADVEATDTADEVAQKVEAFEQRMESLKATHPDKYKKGREAQHIPYKVVKNNLREHQVLIKRNGQTFVVTINGNPRAAQALNGLTNPDVELHNAVGDLLKLATWANRQLSAFYTTRNPDFVVSNFMRDMLYANCMTWVKESPRYALRFHKNFGKFAPISPRRLVRLRKGLNGGTVYSTGMLLRKWENGTLDMTDKYEKYFYEFMMNGGETGYTNVRDIEGHKRAVAAELKKQSSVGKQAWAALGMQLDLLNRSVENCARFAAFVTSREFGRSIDRAIYDAKEVSVNFNKKGSGAKMAKAVGQTNLGKFAAYLGGSGRLAFIFWNAGIQGMANFGRQDKRHPAKFAAGATAMFTLGYIIPILAEMMGGGDGDDDDKNAYYNLAEYVRRSNICFRAGGQWISIPLPIEYRAMYGLGELAYGVTSGNERYSNKELAREIAAQVSQILPIDMLEGGGGLHAFIPSLFKPVTEAYLMNEGWTGLPIYRDNAFNKNDPEWTKAYASADKHLVDFTRWLNETTGGNDYKKGEIDINPAKLEYLLSGTFGGLFTFPNKGEKMRETMFGDSEFEWRNMPIANRLIKSGDERTAYRKLQNEYYKYLKEYKETKRLHRKYENADENGVLGYAERLDFLENSPEFLRAEIFDDFKDIIDANDKALQDGPDDEIRAEIEAEQLADKRELVNALNDPEAYFRSLREAGMLSDDYMNYLERSFGMKLRTQGQ